MTTEKIMRAFEVIADAVDESAARGETPQLLMERGPGFDQKYLVMRLDWLRTTAGAIGYDTSRMRDPQEESAE